MKFKYYIYICLFLLVGQSVMAQIDPPVIISVTVDPQPGSLGAVHLYWEPSVTESTPIGVKGYYIFRYFEDDNHNKGAHLIDSVFTTPPQLIYEYIDTKAQAHIKSESYDIIAFNHINPVSAPTAIHSTLFLDRVVFDSCTMTNTLRWSSYQGWSSGALYDVINANDGTIIQLGISDTVYVHNIQQNTVYNYQVKGVQVGDATIKSLSNSVTVTTTSIVEPDSTLFYISKVVNVGSAIDITANIDANADLKGHLLLASSSEYSNYSEVDFVNFDGSNGVVLSHSESSQPMFYKVNAVNICGNTVLETDVVQPICLNINSTETEVNLLWNSSFIQSSETYSVYVSVDGNSAVELESLLNNKEYTYNYNNSANESSEVFCFRVMATNIYGYTSLSDEQCATRIPKIEFPNAFTPNGDGLNDMFGSFNGYIKNAVVTDFKLIIYDKYGGVIYETDNVSDSWDGRARGGNFVSEGGYIYYLWFKTSQQKVYEQSGAINVVFP